MESGGSMPHSQGLSNNSYPEPNQPNYPHLIGKNGFKKFNEHIYREKASTKV